MPLAKEWENFVVGDVTYDLTHLNEYTFAAADSDGAQRTIAVTFEDHCFTRHPNGPNDNAPLFPGCSRKDGRFCVDRYERSKGIRACIDVASTRNVWSTAHEHYAIVSVEQGGVKAEYGIVFSLDRLKGMQGIDLHMRVRTAHLRDQEPLATFGKVRFSHLVKLRMSRKHPQKLFGRHRQKPQK